MSADYINEDLIAEIFERLPVKSLMRFRCVSKSWCCRISSPAFIRMHTLRSVKAPQKVIMVHELADDKFEDFRSLLTFCSQDQLPLCGHSPGIPTYKIKDYHIVASCNGILCLIDIKDCNIISLWNPSIRYKFKLPRFSLRPPPLSLEFGFGFDPVTNDYKFVRISFNGEGIQDAFVYSMKTGGWCEIALPLPPLFPYTFASCSCFVNGALHWISGRPQNSGECIITFDLSTHVLGTMALPEMGTSRCRRASSLTVLKGCLAVITSDPADCVHHCRIWMMKEYNDVASWCLAFESRTPQSEGGLCSIFELANGDILYKTTFGKQCKVYNLASRRVLYTVADESTDSRASVLTYVDSLALLDIGFPALIAGEQIILAR